MIKIHLKEILKDRGVTAKELAAKLGVSGAAISNIVTGKNYPTYELLENMAKELNVKLSTLLGEEPLKVVDSTKEFAAFVRCNGIHWTADSLDEFNKVVEEVRTIAK